MRARALAGDRELTVKLQVSRPTRDRAPGPSQCGSACSNPVGATNHHQHNQLGGQSCRDDSVGVHAKDDHARDLARDLPETALHVTSRRLTTPPSTAPLTSVVVWAREVLRGVVNSPSINGKDGVAGSIPAGGSTPRLTSANAGHTLLGGCSTRLVRQGMCSEEPGSICIHQPADQEFQAADSRTVMSCRPAQRSLSTSLPGNDEALRFGSLGLRGCDQRCPRP